MQYNHVLNYPYLPDREIEYFLSIQALTQAIILANVKLKTIQDDETKDIICQSIIKGALRRDRIVAGLSRFGVQNPIIQLQGETPKYSPKFDQWYTWWENYFNSLNQTATDEIEKAFIDGDNLSEWYPEGSWKK